MSRARSDGSLGKAGVNDSTSWTARSQGVSCSKQTANFWAPDSINCRAGELDQLAPFLYFLTRIALNSEGVLPMWGDSLLGGASLKRLGEITARLNQHDEGGR